jgi:predicted dehydrogenase
MQALNLAISGCGAITETYHAPALVELSRLGLVRVCALFDPDVTRVEAIQKFFPQAKACPSIGELMAVGPEAAIVASPPSFHGPQTCELLRAGVAVLCEKPMAMTAEAAEEMASVARQTGKPLAVGLLRRFFPALQAVKDMLSAGTLGPVLSFHCAEGGAFGWPAQSASFFQKAASGGGVLLDVGAHVLDLLHWWFGSPASIAYADDAMGGLEANCLINLQYSDFTAEVRLSRDTPLTNRYYIKCEKGAIAWDVLEPTRLDVLPNGAMYVLRSETWRPSQGSRDLRATGVAGTFYSSFTSQLRNFIEATMGRAELRVSGDEAVRSMQVIEQCYRSRRLLKMPWLSRPEMQRAESLGGVVGGMNQ